MKTLRSIVLAALVLAGITSSAIASGSAAPAHKFPITLTDDHGTKITLTKSATRVVSLDPRDTETLFAVGAEKDVVGDGGSAVEGATGISTAFKYPSQWPSKWGRNYPLLSKRLPHIEGGCCGVHFDVEKITSLTPDLVIAPYSETEQDTFAQLRSLGMKVMVLDPSTVAGIMHDITLVGKATGHAANATTVVSSIKTELAAVKSRIKGTQGRPRVYYEIDASNPEQPYTAGPGTFVDEAITLAGGMNLADSGADCSGTLCYPAFSLESLVRLNPQIIILGDSAYGTSASDVKSRSGWQTMSAVSTGKIYPFNDELISRAGPRIVVGIQALARLVHPAAFK